VTIRRTLCRGDNRLVANWLHFETPAGIRAARPVAERVYHRGVTSLVQLPSRPVFEPRRVLVAALATAASVAAASIVVAFLESPLVAISDASPVYLVSVVLVGSRFGMWAGVATAIASFLTYDLLFTEPRFSLIVADPR